MFEWDLRKRVIAGAIAFGVLSTGLCFALVYQSPAKTDEIYSAALKDFEDGDYQNAYYLFSKIGLFSNLKPISIYHRAECARMLDDDKSELKQYQLLFNNYPKHKLSIRSRYLAGQKLVKDRPQLAKKYFEYIIHNAPDTDYAIASDYYLGVILKNKYENAKIFPQSVKDDMQNHFRHYIEKAPSGKLALNAVNDWLSIDADISKDDSLLMAKTCYLFGEYEKARELLNKTDVSEAWALDVKNSYALKNYSRAKYLTENGLNKHAQYVSEDDIIEAVDIYTNLAESKTKAVDRLLGISTGKGRDY